MRYVTLAGTSLSSSRLGFGCSGLHHVLRTRERQALLAAAYDCGIRYFDTAPLYGHGLAERELGRFARTRGRADLIIATKFGLQPSPLLRRVPALMYAQLGLRAGLRRLTRHMGGSVRPRGDYEAAQARTSLEQSLRALAVEHVDILFLHEPQLQFLTEADALVGALARIKREGKARCIGLSGAPLACAEIARRYPSLAEVLQLDAAGPCDDLGSLTAAGVRYHATFGHFRNERAPVPTLLDAAVRRNPDGVILFSTRRPERTRAMTDLLARAERR